MNWDAIGAVGEIVGAAAVVVSVIYLAIQVKGQTRQSKLSATRELAIQHREILDRIIDNDEFAELYLGGVADYDSLPNVSRIKMSMFLRQAFRNFEQQFLHVQNENVEPAYFDSINLAFAEWMTFPGVQQWWEGSKGSFGAEFRARIDTEMGKGKRKVYDSTFKRERAVKPPKAAAGSDH